MVLGDDIYLLAVNVELATLFSTHWAPPVSCPLHVHKADESLQIEALTMVAFIASRRSADQIPGIWIYKADFDLLDGHFVLVDGQCKVSLNKADLVGWIGHNFLIYLIDCLFLA